MLRPHEPVYKGKRLTVWLEAFETPLKIWTNAEAYEESNQALLAIGTNAIPTLLNRIQAKDSSLTFHLRALAQKQHLIKVRVVTAKMWHEEARQGFQILGAEARSAVPELIKIYDRNASSGTRNDVLAALSSMGPAAEEAVPALLQWLHDTNSFSVGFLFSTLGRIHSRPDITVPALISYLNSQRDFETSQAVRALGSFGVAAKPALPALLNVLEYPDWTAFSEAKEAIREICPDEAAKLIVPALIRKLSPDQYFDRQRAVRELDGLGVEAMPAVPALTELLDDPDKIVKEGARDLIRKLCPKDAARLLVPSLIRSLSDSDDLARQLAAVELQDFGAEAKPAVPALIKALSDYSEWVRQAAKDALLRIDPGAAEKAGVLK